MSAAHHLNPRLVALVAAGGMVGTSARYGLTTWMPAYGGWPVATFVENVVGAFLLGALLEALVRRGTESPRGRRTRLGLGTGVLGGFTTFSSVAIELEQLVARGAVLTATSYALATLVAGLGACFVGVVLAARHHRWRRSRLPRDPDAARLDLPASAPATEER